MVELLAGPLVGAAITDKLGAKNWGNLLLALDPELLGDREEIKQRVQVGGRGERGGAVACVPSVGHHSCFCKPPMLEHALLLRNMLLRPLLLL
jgi:hypothetical protein